MVTGLEDFKIKLSFTFCTNNGFHTVLRFSNTSFEDFKKIKLFPLVLDWAVGNVSCEEATKTRSLKCKGNSKCVDSDATGIGYHCQCLPGFEGNPYLHDCQGDDIIT